MTDKTNQIAQLDLHVSVSQKQEKTNKTHYIIVGDLVSKETVCYIGGNTWQFVAFLSISGNNESHKNIKQTPSSKLVVPVESTSVFHSSNLAILFYCLFLLIMSLLLPYIL